MKVLAIFSAILVVVACFPKLRRTHSAPTGPVVKTWTIKELFNALENKKNPEIQPYIEDGANQFMLALFLNVNWKNVLAAVASPSGKNTWNNKELSDYMDIIADADEEYQSAIEHAHSLLNELEKDNPGADIKDIPVAIGAVDISTWNHKDVDEAISDPDTRTELKPYLEQAVKELDAKNDSEATVTLVTPVGLIKNNPELLEFTIPPTLVPYLKKKLRSEAEVPATTELPFFVLPTFPLPTEEPSSEVTPEEAFRSRSQKLTIPHGVFLQIFALRGRKKIDSVIKKF